jgi:CO/xanthine dehydrogenase FAD-binding subunit
VRTSTRDFSLRRERTLAGALRVLREEPGTVPLAGCTDAYVALQFGQQPGTRYLDLTPLAALKKITTSGDRLVIGALATYTDLQRSRLVRTRLPMLVEAAHTVGGAQIQNRGTVGGNIANASPAGDTLPVVRRVRRRGGAAGRRGRAAGAVHVVLHRLPAERAPPRRAHHCCRSARGGGPPMVSQGGTRAAQAICKVVWPACAPGSPALALGSVGPTVVRLPRTEALLASGTPIEAALDALRAEISPIDDVRSTADYRRDVAANLVREFWARTA